jgi:hypothetical protein
MDPYLPTGPESTSRAKRFARDPRRSQAEVVTPITGREVDFVESRR